MRIAETRRDEDEAETGCSCCEEVLATQPAVAQEEELEAEEKNAVRSIFFFSPVVEISKKIETQHFFFSFCFILKNFNGMKNYFR